MGLKYPRPTGSCVRSSIANQGYEPQSNQSYEPQKGTCMSPSAAMLLYATSRSVTWSGDMDITTPHSKEKYYTTRKWLHHTAENYCTTQQGKWLHHKNTTTKITTPQEYTKENYCTTRIQQGQLLHHKKIQENYYTTRKSTTRQGKLLHHKKITTQHGSY